tara:strand:+ start:807 stop:1808 length:1002 start_codon:yes stop_codon:yes gene_type:complete
MPPPGRKHWTKGYQGPHGYKAGPHCKPRGRPPNDTTGKPKKWDYTRGFWVDDKRSKRPVGEEGDKGPDLYDSMAKKSHRHEFAINCANKASNSESRDILYLETSAGMTTKMLLDNGFAASDLHPCNRNGNELAKLAKKHPGLHVHIGDILDVYKRGHERSQSWLGIWFDLETSLISNGDWNEKVPIFSRAVVCAVTLTNSHNRGFTTDELAKKLQELMSSDNNYDMSPQMARAYNGKSNQKNMVFGLAHYSPPVWDPQAYLYQRVHVPLNYYGKFNGIEDYKQVNDHLVATVTSVSRDGKALHLTYQDNRGIFFVKEDLDPPVAPDVLDQWIV